LYFINGHTRELRCRGGDLLALMQGACGGAELSPWQAEQLELIRQSVAAKEPGGAHMIELVRCLLYAEAEVQKGGTQDDC
jgi:hypothetical protein